ncbi:MAG: hypothetical protein QNJ42_15595 [Crocosphaera sp.]|nr:hypothetical protein [Crocosphaera sp.]
MDNTPANIKDHFLYPISPYHGALSKDKVIFNAKLQEFAQKVGFIANLYTGGKLPSEEAYGRVESLWRELELMKAIITDDPST